MRRALWHARHLKRLAAGCAVAGGAAWAGIASRAEAERHELRKEYKYVIAGGGIAARAAAEVLATEDPGGSLLIVAPWWAGMAPGAERGDTHLAASELVGVDPRTQTATLSGGTSVQYTRAMLLAVGGTAPMPPLGTVLAHSAANAGVVCGVRSAADRVRAAAVLTRPQTDPLDRPHLTVVGGGWVGVAVGAELAARGADLTFVYGEPHLLARQATKYVASEVRRRLRHLSLDGCDYLAYAGLRHARMDLPSGEVDVYAGVVFDPLADVVFRTDHVLLAPTSPPATQVDAPTLELRDNAYVVNKELAMASNVYAAGACSLAPGVDGVRWSEEYAVQSGRHAAANMMGACEPFTPPRHVTVDLRLLRARCTVVEDADPALESLGYFTVAKEAGEQTCGGNLQRGVVFFLEQHPQKTQNLCLFGVAGALLWDGTYAGDDDSDDEDEIVAKIIDLIDAEPEERGVIENRLDELAQTEFGVARAAEDRGENVGRVLWRRHTSARTVPLQKEEVMWITNSRPGEYLSVQTEKAAAYSELLRRAAGAQ